MLIFVLRQPQPELAIQLTSSQVQISWPSAVTNFNLVSTTNLMAGPWNPVSAPPVAADATQTVTVGATNAPQFFQLRLP